MKMKFLRYLQGNPFNHMPMLLFNWQPHYARVYEQSTCFEILIISRIDSYMRCSGRHALPQFPAQTHLYFTFKIQLVAMSYVCLFRRQCTTKAVGIEMSFDEIMRQFVEKMGYKCKDKDEDRDYELMRPVSCTQCPVGTESREGQCTACPAGIETGSKRPCRKHPLELRSTTR